MKKMNKSYIKTSSMVVNANLTVSDDQIIHFKSMDMSNSQIGDT